MYPTAQENCHRRLNFEICNKQDKVQIVYMPQNAEQSKFLYEKKIPSLNSSSPSPLSWWFYWSWHSHGSHKSQ